jgi:hypothetical protein
MTGKKTRKNYFKRNMYGGEIPYASGASDANILTKLQNLTQETLQLKSWANEYKEKTDALNNSIAMSEQLAIARHLSRKSGDVYARAQALWQSVYGTPWVPPPSPAPAPI